MDFRKQIANIITISRILGSIYLLYSPVFSFSFYIMYLFCGITDMIDGTIARKTNSSSEFGAKIDTAADLVFVIAAMIKIFPTINIPKWLWIWCIVIAIIKIGNIIWGYICKKQFIALHTKMNKITGLLLFLFPLTLSFIKVKYSFVVVCVVATVAAIQESFFIRKEREIV